MRVFKLTILFFLLFFLYSAGSVWVMDYQSKFDCYSVEGDSMLPTLTDGSSVSVRYDTPKINDVVVFRCLVDKCEKKTLIKRLITIKDSCYYFMGDNRFYSSDSRNYGYLCPDEISIIGVVDKS